MSEMTSTPVKVKESRPRRWDSSDLSGPDPVSTLLLVWSVLYALPHLYWGLGGTIDLSTLKPSAPATDDFEAANLVAFVLITCAGFIGFGLERTRRRPRPRLLLLTVAGAGCAIAAAHGAYGILFRALSIAGLRDVDGEPFDRVNHGWVLWDMLAIEPWFLAEGILLGLAGYVALRSEQQRALWLRLVGGAFLLAFASAALSLRFG